MIQRIQTLYLLAITGFMTALCLMPMATYTVAGVEESFMAYDFWWIITLFGVCALLPFVTIWLYKNRLTQIRLIVAEIVLLVGAQAFSVWYSIGITRQVAAQEAISMSSIKTPVFFPVVCIILCWLAIRAIWKDERLVRSLDRIR